MEHRSLLRVKIALLNRFGTQLETRRWWILLCFSLYNACTSFSWLTFNVTTDVSLSYFKISTSKLLLFSDTGLYESFLFSYLGCWLAYKMFKPTLLVCTFLMLVGGWMRYFAGENYALALTGQLLIGLSGASAFGISTLIPDRWFSSHERLLVTTIALYSNYFGWAMGYILPCLIIGSDSKNMPLNVLIQAIIMTLPFVIGVFCVENRPKVPPSYSALVKLTDHFSFWEEMKILIKMPHFVASSLTFGVFISISFSISTTSGIYMEPLNLTYFEQGLIGFSFIATGMIAGLLGTMWINRRGYQSCDLVIKALLSLAIISLLALWWLFTFIEVSNFLLLLLGNCLLGIGFIGIVPFACISVIESTFPVQESISSNAMSMVAMITSVLVSHASTSEYISHRSFLFLAVVICPSWIYGFFFHQTNYKRQKVDQQHQQINEDLRNSIVDIEEHRAPPARKQSLFDMECILSSEESPISAYADKEYDSPALAQQLNAA